MVVNLAAVPGDEHFGFDPNAFVQRLVEETGIAHVWEPVQIKVPEGGRCYTFMSAGFEGQVPNPEREAKRYARELAWNIWKRFAPSLDEVLLHSDKESGDLFCRLPHGQHGSDQSGRGLI